jgi:fumarate reductase flavoprotein subunit
LEPSRLAPWGNGVSLRWQAQDAQERATASLRRGAGGEPLAAIRNEMALAMESGCGIYRAHGEISAACNAIAGLKARCAYVALGDRTPAWNTEWLSLIELGYQLDVAQAMAHSALERRESRGAHQRLDADCTARDDEHYLKHTLAYQVRGNAPRIEWTPVTITKSPPGVRAYGAAGEAREKAHA